MDDYRQYLKNTHVVSIGALLDSESNFKDDQIVSVAGIIQNMKMKTTRSGSMMAYVTVEDDTASMEMLAFSNVLSQFGGYLRENSAVVITGRLSLRDDKEAQIVINRARPISDYADEALINERQEEPAVLQGTLWLKLVSESDPVWRKVKSIVSMFPGNSQVKVFFVDTRIRLGSRATLDSRMISELKNLLGDENVVLE